MIKITFIDNFEKNKNGGLINILKNNKLEIKSKIERTEVE